MSRHPGIVLVFILLIVVLSLALAEDEYLLFSEKKRQQIEHQHGTEVAERLSRWKTFVEESQHKSEQEKLKLTNDFFNQQLLWISDI